MLMEMVMSVRNLIWGKEVWGVDFELRVGQTKESGKKRKNSR